MARRHGLPLALAVTDADVDCDTVDELTSDAVGVIEPDREDVAHTDMVIERVFLGDEDAQAEARKEPVQHALPERDAVMVALADGQLVDERERVPDPLKEVQLDVDLDRVGEPEKVWLTDPEREVKLLGGRDGDCVSVPNCVVVREPVLAADDEREADWQPDTDADLEIDLLPETEPVREGDPLLDRENVLVIVNVGVVTSVGGLVCVIDDDDTCDGDLVREVVIE
jgi:hypothetical protein